MYTPFGSKTEILNNDKIGQLMTEKGSSCFFMGKNPTDNVYVYCDKDQISNIFRVWIKDCDLPQYIMLSIARQLTNYIKDSKNELEKQYKIDRSSHDFVYGIVGHNWLVNHGYKQVFLTQDHYNIDHKTKTINFLRKGHYKLFWTGWLKNSVADVYIFENPEGSYPITESLRYFNIRAKQVNFVMDKILDASKL